MIDVTVMIVSFNTREMTLACLDSVYAQTTRHNLEVIVVDNGSADGSAEAIARRFPRVVMAGPGQNLGFAAANNLASRLATGRHLLLLNPDTVVLDGAIDRLVQFADQSSGPAIFGGRTLFGDGSLNPESCHGAPTLWSLLCSASGLSSFFRKSRLFDPESLGGWRRDSVREVDIISGGFLLIPAGLWRQLGGFDPDFFMYGEDSDLCLRARKAGARCLICPDATIIHYGGASERVRADKMIRLYRAKAQLFRRHWSAPSAAIGVAMLCLSAWMRMVGLSVLARLRRSWSEAAATWARVWRRRGEYTLGSLPDVTHELAGNS